MKSTSLRTVEGKNAVRANALKHGLTAKSMVALGENAEAFQLMADDHLGVFRPENSVDVELARTFSIAAWQRLRCVSTSTSMVNQYIRDTTNAQRIGEQEDVLALGARLFHDNQKRWELFPDPDDSYWTRAADRPNAGPCSGTRSPMSRRAVAAGRSRNGAERPHANCTGWSCFG
jgi:hypothetical protein